MVIDIVNKKTAVTILYFLAILVHTVLFTPHRAYSDEGDAGANTAQILRKGVGTRGPAMGGAQTAYVGDATALHYNPAGLSQTNKNNLSFGFQQLVADITQGDMYYTMPHNNNSYSSGIGIKYIDYGSVDRTTVGVNNGVTTATANGEFGGNDLALTYGLSSSVTSNLNAGFSAKYVRLEIDDVTASGPAVDAGLQWTWPNYGMIHGLVMKNAGPDLTFQEADESLPTVVRYGVAKSLPNDIVLSADIEREVNLDSMGYMLGAHWQFVQNFAINIGYDGRVDIDNGFTGGFDFVASDKLKVGYSYQPFGELGNNHKFSLSWSWGKPSYKNQAKEGGVVNKKQQNNNMKRSKTEKQNNKIEKINKNKKIKAVYDYSRSYLEQELNVNIKTLDQSQVNNYLIKTVNRNEKVINATKLNKLKRGKNLDMPSLANMQQQSKAGGTQ